MSVKCSIHGKMRTLVNLEEIGVGEFRCKHSSPCKVTAAGGDPYSAGSMQPAMPGMPGMFRTSRDLAAAGHSIIHPKQTEVCYAHGKKRAPAQLYQVMTAQGPQWECLPEARCKLGEMGGQPRVPGMPGANPMAQRMGAMGMGGLPQMTNRFNPYGQSLSLGTDPVMSMGGMFAGRGGGARAPAGVAGMSTQQQICSLHNKKRSMQSLELTPDGRYQCTAQDTCKTRSTDTSNLATCFIHNKQRKMEYLVSDGKGNMQCAPDAACQ